MHDTLKNKSICVPNMEIIIFCESHASEIRDYLYENFYEFLLHGRKISFLKRKIYQLLERYFLFTFTVVNLITSNKIQQKSSKNGSNFRSRKSFALFRVVFIGI